MTSGFPSADLGTRSWALLLVSVLSVTAGAVQRVSVRDEIAIGKQAQAQVKRETPEVSDAPVQAFVARLGRQLAAHARGSRYPYSFSVANYREINAHHERSS